MKTDTIEFTVSTGSRTGKNWPGSIKPLNPQREPHEFEITGRGSQFHVIIGTYSRGGYYLCIPNRSVGSDLAGPQDIFWNREQLYHNTSLNKADASTVACGIATASAMNLL